MGSGSSKARAVAPEPTGKQAERDAEHAKLQAKFDSLQAEFDKLQAKYSTVAASAAAPAAAPAAASSSATPAAAGFSTRNSLARQNTLTFALEASTRFKMAAAERKDAKRVRERIIAAQGDMENMKTVFDQISLINEPHDMIKFGEFCEVLNEKLHIGLGTEELGRVWDNLTDEQKGVPRGDRMLGFTAFAKGLTRLSFLRELVTQLSQGVPDFAIPEDYNWSKKTSDNYAAPVEDGFHGAYQDVRAERDYKYHVNYTKARQLWQDQVIERVVTRTEPQPAPWIVYTCGPPGAGKGYALEWMSAHGYFPLEAICHVDPDHFKQAMPEWDGYVERNRETASNLMHKESGFLQEVAQEVAMRNSQNVWNDGTLKDGNYFAGVFRRVRQDYPQYKIAIFEVTASEKTVRARIKERENRTGRAVPEWQITESLKGVNNSLAILTPLADFVAKIDNSGNSAPKLQAYSRVDNSGNWSVIQSQFANAIPDPGAFPSSLAPLMLCSMPLDVGAASRLSSDYGADAASMVLRTQDGSERVGGSADAMVTARFDLRCSPLWPTSRYKALQHALLKLSPTFPVNMPSDARKLAGIPDQAHSFAFCYPSLTAPPAEPGGGAPPPANALSDLLAAGGFIYFDTSDNVVAVNAISSLGFTPEKPKRDADVSASDLSEVTRAATARARPIMIQFEPPERLPEATARALTRIERLREVTLPLLTRKGVSHFGWIRPGEKLPGLASGGSNAEDAPYPPRFGAFCYIFDEDMASAENCYFPIANVG